MNSEELEVSLRAEFETYLKNTLAEMKQEVSQLQEKVTAELERHKSQLDEAFQLALGNFEKEHEFEESFKESVVEHLRLARDEGAQITAMAIAKAEELEKDSPSASIGVKEIYEAVNDISTKPSQSEILKTLVHHATHFAPRGAFFIVKNEHLVGWRVFGKEKGAAEEKVREVFLPVTADSVLSESVKSLATVGNENGGLSADAEILEKLEFGEPNKMVAIPLIARGRGVAVLYADYGNEGGSVNIEALETLVRVAGLTVEVLASNKTAVASRKAVSRKPEEEAAANDVSFSETGGLSSEVLSNYQSFVSTPTAATMAEPSYQSFTSPATAVQETVETVSEADGFATDDSEIEETRSAYSYEPAFQTEPETQVEEVPVAEFSDAYTAVEQETVSEVEITAPTAEFESFAGDSPAQDFESAEKTVEFETSSWATPVSQEEVQTETPAYQVEEQTETFAPQVEEPTETFVQEETVADVQEETVADDYNKGFSYQTETEEKYPAFDTTSPWSSTTTETTPGFSAQEYAENFAKETDPAEYAKDFSYQAESNDAVKDYGFQSSNQSVETETVAPTEEFVPTKEQTFEVENGATQTVAPKSRLSERNVDLPIEVGEEERRLHNDARRFARLLVSEIKLYNEQKVKEGRDSSDLYDRLKEAIDRSREMYDKRVQPPVAAKFDYFHYELVNTLAEGDDNKLGSDYPGSAV